MRVGTVSEPCFSVSEDVQSLLVDGGLDGGQDKQGWRARNAHEIAAVCSFRKIAQFTHSALVLRIGLLHHSSTGSPPLLGLAHAARARHCPGSFAKVRI
jgi:hypothetical protein